MEEIKKKTKSLYKNPDNGDGGEIPDLKVEFYERNEDGKVVNPSNYLNPCRSNSNMLLWPV